MRTMKHVVDGTTLYESFFDEKTGIITRKVIAPDRHYSRSSGPEFEKRYRLRSYSNNLGFAPSPETVDISITDRCDFGCAFCYQDSKPKRDHAPADLVEAVLTGFDQVPYQIAIGGGEPTMHPEFTSILRKARECGTVPNYTTAGHRMTPDIVEATNEVCGGVAMTYHAFKGGIEWFVDHYRPIREALKCQVNVHLIADKDVAKNLVDLIAAQEKIGRLNLVLLAYYPDVGRASMDYLMTRAVYAKKLPDAIKRARDARMQIAFSEGLLPYFNSRPEIGIDTRFALPSEGQFSCYVNPRGQLTHSSFSPDELAGSVYLVRAQKLWDELRNYMSEPRGEACYDCPARNRCSTPHDFHYFACAFAAHNKEKHV